MKNKGGGQNGKYSLLGSHCVDKCSFVSENVCFRFRSALTNWIGDIKPFRYRRDAVNILFLFVMHLYIECC
jgi:hypothetical protein